MILEMFRDWRDVLLGFGPKKWILEGRPGGRRCLILLRIMIGLLYILTREIQERARL